MFGWLNPVKWLQAIFDHFRLSKVKEYLPVAVQVAEAIAQQDWNGDGKLITRREAEEYVIRYLTTMTADGVSTWLKAHVFNELFQEDGTVFDLVVRMMTDRNLKRLTAVVLFVRKVVAQTGGFPTTLSAGLIETLIQLGYERTKKTA